MISPPLFRISVLLLTTLMLGSALGRAESSLPPKAGSLEVETGGAITAVLAAWRRADAKAIADQYETDGDFVSPTGEHATGKQAIEAFYRNAFEAGYAQSDANATVLHVRALSPTYAIVDGSWMILPLRSSKIIESESGLFVAVLHRHEGRWRIAALREQSSAQEMREIAPMP